MGSIQAITISHLVIATDQVSYMTDLFQTIYGVEPRYHNNDFADFQLPGGSRVAFFKPLGKSAQLFQSTGSRASVAFGLTVEDIYKFYEHCCTLSDKFGITFSGPPKEHSWGEPSFLLIDADGNRWEVTQSPSDSGLLVERK